MCGRFTLTADPDAIRAAFPNLTVPAQIRPRYNVAPSQPVAVIANSQPDKLDFYLWGLIPSWSKDLQMSQKMINARGETLAEKPSFRTAYRRRRCLILADGFYEWQKNSDKSKTPMHIRLKSGEPFAFAGLWELWHSPDGDPVYSCTIITTTPNTLMKSIHDRMPVILEPGDYPLWLEPGELNPEVLNPLIRPFPPEQMDAYSVSTLVNSPANDVPECLLPA